MEEGSPGSGGGRAGALRRRAATAAALLLLLVAAAAGWRWFSSASMRFLTPLGGGEWLAPAGTFGVLTHPYERDVVSYRTRFRAALPVAGATLRVRAFRDCSAWLDDACILPFDGGGDWREEREARLPSPLPPGDHELRIDVANDDGPPLVKCASPALGLASGEGWEAGRGGAWAPAPRAAARGAVPQAADFPGSVDALLATLPFYLPAFLAGAALSLAADRGTWRLGERLSALAGGGRFRWFVYGFWALLGVHNTLAVDDFFGLDVDYHLEYVTFLLEQGRIPLASDLLVGWHPPLFHLAAAAFAKLLMALSLPPAPLMLLPLLCGALQVEVAWRALRFAFPGREGLQAMATLFVGLSPVNVYMSHGISNEPLAAVLSAAAFLLALQMATGEDPRLASPLRVRLLGLLLGAALLSKVSALLLVPPLALAVARGALRRGDGARGAARRLAELLSIALLLCGWWYGRNLARFGRPFRPNWERGNGFMGWQDPGYWMPEHLVAFGRSLVRPVYSGVGSVLDSLYSTAWCDGWVSGLVPLPPWGYGFVCSSVLLALLPASAVLWGGLRGARRAAGAVLDPLSFSLAFASLYLGAILLAYLAVPFYSGMKASHALAALPAFALLAAAGLDGLLRRPLARAAAWGTASAWVVMVAGGYFLR